MRRTAWIILVLLTVRPLQAQYDDLLRNPQVVWVAEYTTDFFLNPGQEDPPAERPNFLYTIRLENLSAQNGLMGLVSSPAFLSEQVLANAWHGPGPAYADSTTQKVLSPAALEARLVRVDTVVGSCDASFEEKFYLVRNERSVSDISAFRVRQVFWYDARRRQFGARLLAYAPLYDVKDMDGNWLNERSPLFWLKGQAKAPKRRKDRHFAYVFQTKMVDNAPGMEDFQVIKGQLDLQQLVNQEVARPTHRWVNLSNETIGAAEMAAACFGVDTSIEYVSDSGRWQTVLQPWNRILEIDRISFVQNWYYDQRRHRLYNRLVGWRPLRAVRFEDGSVLYRYPLFSQVYR